MFLSDEQILKRLRGQLARCGVRVHKVRGEDGSRYIPYSAADPDEQGQPLSLNGLIDFAERRMERRREYLLRG